eukprot:GHVN01065681.1.p1 GENE.GHVN01065681.1~~GHVN01065681.1.p1  ORF type:complete len:728 (+),score=134.35 GHVN01065681.1:1850-4033(+)
MMAFGVNTHGQAQSRSVPLLDDSVRFLCGCFLKANTEVYHVVVITNTSLCLIETDDPIEFEPQIGNADLDESNAAKRYPRLPADSLTDLSMLGGSSAANPTFREVFIGLAKRHGRHLRAAGIYSMDGFGGRATALTQACLSFGVPDDESLQEILSASAIHPVVSFEGHRVHPKNPFRVQLKFRSRDGHATYTMLFAQPYVEPKLLQGIWAPPTPTSHGSSETLATFTQQLEEAATIASSPPQPEPPPIKEVKKLTRPTLVHLTEEESKARLEASPAATAQYENLVGSELTTPSEFWARYELLHGKPISQQKPGGDNLDNFLPKPIIGLESNKGASAAGGTVPFTAPPRSSTATEDDEAQAEEAVRVELSLIFAEFPSVRRRFEELMASHTMQAGEFRNRFLKSGFYAEIVGQMKGGTILPDDPTAASGVQSQDDPALGTFHELLQELDAVDIQRLVEPSVDLISSQGLHKEGFGTSEGPAAFIGEIASTAGSGARASSSTEPASGAKTSGASAGRRVKYRSLIDRFNRHAQRIFNENELMAGTDRDAHYDSSGGSPRVMNEVMLNAAASRRRAHLDEDTMLPDLSDQPPDKTTAPAVLDKVLRRSEYGPRHAKEINSTSISVNSDFKTNDIPAPLLSKTGLDASDGLVSVASLKQFIDHIETWDVDLASLPWPSPSAAYELCYVHAMVVNKATEHTIKQSSNIPKQQGDRTDCRFVSIPSPRSTIVS